MAKRRVGKYPKKFRRMAVERLKTCDNIVELSQELGVHRRLLYKWRDQFDQNGTSSCGIPILALRLKHSSWRTRISSGSQYRRVAGEEMAPPIKIDISAIPKFRVPAS